MLFNFNPPTPCGVGLPSGRNSTGRTNFNPPTPCGVGQRTVKTNEEYYYFNPPTPCGVGPAFLNHLPVCLDISIHPPRVGWDTIKPYVLNRTLISIHPPRVGWDDCT